MRRIVRHIAFGVLWLSVLCFCNSCVYDRYDASCGVEPAGDDTPTVFVLHITPMSMQGAPGAQSEGRVAEKIRSLRVIAISHPDEEGTDGGNVEDRIEINRLVKFDGELTASELQYSLWWSTAPGKKDFYIFANEETVLGDNGGALQFAADANVPDAVRSLTSLTEVFNRYKATPAKKFGLSDNANEPTDNKTDDDAAETPSSVSEFKAVINALHFAPQYTIESGSIFLPYSTCYEDVEVEAEKTVSKDMYLVPVATKFYFRFYNYREHAVKIQKLSIEQTDSRNFLLAQVGDDDRTKVFISDPDDESKNEPYYWVDWLAKVADETHKNLTTDNSDINELYGWISDYSMPKTSTQAVQTLIGGDGSGLVGGRAQEKELTIDAVGPLEDMAGELYLGPYYFPESRYMVPVKDENGNDTSDTVQQYTLGLLLHDMEADSSSRNDFEDDLVIGNVRSLFRNTCVLIQVTMKSGGDVEAYAEIKDWEHNEVKGWASDGSILP